MGSGICPVHAQEAATKSSVAQAEEHNHEVFDLVTDAGTQCATAWDAQEQMKPLLQRARTENDHARAEAALVEAERLLGEIWLHLGTCRDDLHALRLTVNDAHAPKKPLVPVPPPTPSQQQR
jgi:hypothetical protein